MQIQGLMGGHQSPGRHFSSPVCSICFPREFRFSVWYMGFHHSEDIGHWNRHVGILCVRLCVLVNG